MKLDDFDADTLAMINTEIADRISRQSDALDKIDNKAVLVVGYVLAVVSFLATRPVQPILAAFAYSAFAVAAIAGLVSLAIRPYLDTNPIQLISYAKRSPAEILPTGIASQAKVLRFNSGRQRTKVRSWWISISGLAVGTILMVAAILVQTYEHDQPVHTSRQSAATTHHHKHAGQPTAPAAAPR
jgi:hypothetical protein